MTGPKKLDKKHLVMPPKDRMVRSPRKARERKTLVVINK